MRTARLACCALFVGCTGNTTVSHLPTDAGLPADVRTLAPAPLQPALPLATEDIGGVTYVSALQSTVAVALPMDTPPLTQALWVRQVMQSLPDLSLDGVTATVDNSPGLVVWTLQAPPEAQSSALDTLLSALTQPQLSDDGLAGALSTRPQSADPVDPATLRSLHEQVAVRTRLWVAATEAARDVIATGTASWAAGEPVPDAEAWLATHAQQHLAAARCRVGTMASNSTEDIRSVARGAIDRRTATAAALHAWRAGTPTRDALHQAITTAPLPDAAEDCLIQ